MTARRPKVLFVTDLAYPARGRRYGDEDILLTSRLREDFDIALCHPRDAVALMDAFDLVVVRNSGPVIHYREAYEAFREHVRTHRVPVYNPLTGRGDMAGKGYLPLLTRAGYPVIPTVGRPGEVGLLPAADRYVVKPEVGADSIGLRILDSSELAELPATPGEGLLIQPLVDFRYEVSFLYMDGVFRYALYTPDPGRRWELSPYEPTGADLEFARRFVEWNTLDHGIQRIDACRTRDGGLLLVELEDLNPHLSLDRVPEAVREDFLTAFTESLHRFAALHPRP
ncbi:hypothetical protein FNQ90_14490 [Streptomyces alkaliphilus]|uniref:ATP-grasp domain-containing protein n=1 Tax=Streptomyces alkaliphilus TaxID=1472722 RepID=A0A7W3Y284_9ACTN|nr:hypothetical protein [Streptomyces alkaliphilus]MBB0245278.1 hypothetical protein [Streptomyces alkaliphilus]